MKKIILCLLILSATLSSAVFAKNDYLEKLTEVAQDPNNAYIIVEAHRAGWDKMVPENSLLSIEKGISEGADSLEIDVRLTKDHKLIVMHDSSLDRTTTLSGSVRDYTLAQIQAAKLRSADNNITKFSPPSLSAALDAMKDKVLFRLDIKCGDECVTQVYDMVKAKGMMYQAIADKRSYKIFHKYYKGDDSKFIALGGNYPDYKTAKDLSKGFDWIWVKDFDGKHPPVKKMQAFKPHTRLFMMPYQDNRAGMHGDRQSLFNPDAGWGWLIKQGATVILTNEPARLISYLNKNGLRNKSLLDK